MKKKQPIVVLVLIILTLAISVSSQQDSGHTCVNKLNCLQKLSGEGYSANQISCIQSKCMVTPLNESEGYEPENNEEILEGDVLTEEPPLENQEPIQTIEINNLKSEVAKLKTEISTIKGSIQTQSGSTTILKNDVNVVKNQVKQIESQLTTINNQLSNSLNQIQNSVSGVSTGLAALQEEVNSTQTGLTSLEEDLETRKSRTILLFFLVILAVAGGTFYFIYRKKRPTKIKQTQPDIINYITGHIKQGIKFPEIKNKLLQAGWSSSDIDAAYQKTMKHNYQKYLKKNKSSTRKTTVVTPTKKKAFDPKKGIAIAVISVLLMVGVLLVLKEATGKAIHIQESFAHDEIYECTPPHIVSPEGGCCLDNRTFTNEACESNQHCIDFVYPEEITLKIEDVSPNVKKSCISTVCVIEGIGNDKCDTEEEYEIEKVEVSAEICDDHNQCTIGKICLNNQCTTIEEQYNTDCQGRKCNLNQIQISTSDNEMLTLAPGKGGYTAAGAVDWTIEPIPNYCEGEEIKLPIEIEKKGMVCYSQSGEKISCNQQTDLVCINDNDCQECSNLYNTACKCTANICELNVISTKKIEILKREIIMLNIGQTSQPITHPSPGINRQLNDFTLTLNNANEFCFG